MRIVYMGTPDFAAVILKRLAATEHDILLCVTQPDRPRGRSGKLQMSDVKACAMELELPVYQPERVRTPEAVETIMECEPDIIVVAAFGQILPKSILEIPPRGCVNVHASLLPKLRGASPIQTAILEGYERTGVTIMQMGEGLDTGDILSWQSVEIQPDDTGGSLFDKLADMGGELLVRTLKDLEEDRVVPIPQDESRATYAGLIKKDMGLIDWNEDAEVIERKVRALDPWPSAFTLLDLRTLKIWRAAALETDRAFRDPGRISEVGKDYIDVNCGHGKLRILELQQEGRKRMSTHDLLLGYHIEPGTALGLGTD